EEELDVFEDELPLGDGEKSEQCAYRPSPQSAPHEPLRTLLRLCEPRGVQLAMEQCAQGDRAGGRRPEQDERQGVVGTLQEAHGRLRRPLAWEEGRRRCAKHRYPVEQV